MGKRHSLNVIEARQAGNDVDRDIMDIVLHPEVSINFLFQHETDYLILKFDVQLQDCSFQHF